MTRTRTSLFAALAVASASFFYLACDDSSSAVKEPAADSGTNNPRNDGGPGPGTDGGDGGPTDCVQNPTTHEEIINACTNAVRIAKNPTLPKLLPDGALPPLE